MSVSQLSGRACTQTAVYWNKPNDDGYGGRSFDSGYPEEIDCRWENRTDTIKDAIGKEVVSRASVYLTQDVEQQGWLYLGSIDDLDSAEQEGDPADIDGAFEIIRFDKIPEFKSTDRFLRIAYL